MITTENVQPKYFNLLQTNRENLSEIEFPPNVITPAITARISTQLRSLQSTLTEKNKGQTSNQNTSFGFQPQTETTSVKINPNINNTETIESIFPTEITGTSIPTSSALIPGITIPLQVPTKTILSNSDSHNESNTSEKFTSQDNSYGATPN